MDRRCDVTEHYLRQFSGSLQIMQKTETSIPIRYVCLQQQSTICSRMHSYGVALSRSPPHLAREHIGRDAKHFKRHSIDTSAILTAGSAVVENSLKGIYILTCGEVL